MRARKKKNTIPRLERCSEYLTEQIVSETGRDFYIEIGCGKGKFITSLAESRPDDFFYAVEKVPDGVIFMKTDNQGLFDFSLAEFRRYGYELFDVVRDLHASDVENCFTTEYEDRFTALGQPIFHLKARPVPGYEPPEDERPVAGTEDSERNIELDSVPER